MTSALTVRSVGYAAVKGTRHLARPAVELDERGAVGDRALCFVDPEARRVLRTVQNPWLLSLTAHHHGDELTIDLPTGARAEGALEPTGQQLTCDYWGRAVDLDLVGGAHAGLVSEWLRRDVLLAAAPRGAVVYADPVTLIGTASLRALSEMVGDAEVVDEAARFRATVVVETDEPWLEETWMGQSVDVGGARVRIGSPIPRCAVIDHHPSTGVKDRSLLTTLARHRPRNAAGEPMFGVFASVLRPSVIRTVPPVAPSV